MLNCCRKWIKTSRISHHIILLVSLTVFQSLAYSAASRQPQQHGGGGSSARNRNLIETEQQCKVRRHIKIQKISFAIISMLAISMSFCQVVLRCQWKCARFVVRDVYKWMYDLSTANSPTRKRPMIRKVINLLEGFWLHSDKGLWQFQSDHKSQFSKVSETELHLDFAMPT